MGNNPNQAVMAAAQPTAPNPARISLVATLAKQYEMEPGPFMEAIVQTVMPTKNIVLSNAMVATFLMVCHEHGLNPFTREIFAFPSKTGGIQPIVSVDGWVKLVTRHPSFDGMDFVMEFDDKKKPVSCTCKLYVKNRTHPTEVTEYYEECYRNTDPWNNMPRRMLRHKALKEAGRYAFGFSGIMDQDEAMDAINITDQSTVLERSTDNAKEALKEKIATKKTNKQEPVVTAPGAAGSVNVVSSAPAQTVIAPAPAPPAAAVEPKVSDDQRKAFIAKAKEKAIALEASEDQTKTKMREIIFNVGCTKFVEIPASRFEETMKALDEWTLPSVAPTETDI